MCIIIVILTESQNMCSFVQHKFFLFFFNVTNLFKLINNNFAAAETAELKESR